MRKSILLVDDTPDNLRLLTTILSMLDFNVITAEDGRIALELYKRHQKEIVLVVTDYVMPNMNGRELLIAIRAINPQVKAIMATGTDYKFAKSFPEPNEVFSKPFSTKDFMETCRRLCAQPLAV